MIGNTMTLPRRPRKPALLGALVAVCAGIVKEHDGWIEVDDGSAGGAVFRVHLPAAEAAPERRERAMRVLAGSKDQDAIEIARLMAELPK